MDGPRRHARRRPRPRCRDGRRRTRRGHGLRTARRRGGRPRGGLPRRRRRPARGRERGLGGRAGRPRDWPPPAAGAPRTCWHRSRPKRRRRGSWSSTSTGARSTSRARRSRSACSRAPSRTPVRTSSSAATRTSWRAPAGRGTRWWATASGTSRGTTTARPRPASSASRSTPTASSASPGPRPGSPRPTGDRCRWPAPRGRAPSPAGATGRAAPAWRPSPVPRRRTTRRTPRPSARSTPTWRSGCRAAATVRAVPCRSRDLRHLTMTHRDFDGVARTGEMIVHRRWARDVTEVFGRLYAAGWPIARMRLVDDYGADDDASMAANNSSGFNCRRVAGQRSWSDHAYGAAIDLNPLQNPYVRPGSVDPPAGRRFARVDRGRSAPAAARRDQVRRPRGRRLRPHRLGVGRLLGVVPGLPARGRTGDALTVMRGPVHLPRWRRSPGTAGRAHGRRRPHARAGAARGSPDRRGARTAPHATGSTPRRAGG